MSERFNPSLKYLPTNSWIRSRRRISPGDNTVSGLVVGVYKAQPNILLCGSRKIENCSTCVLRVVCPNPLFGLLRVSRKSIPREKVEEYIETE